MSIVAGKEIFMKSMELKVADFQYEKNMLAYWNSYDFSTKVK